MRVAAPFSIVPVVAIALLPPAFFNSTVATIVFGGGTLTIVLLPIAMAIAILRYRLYDIDLVINRTVAYGALAVAITLIYVAVVVGIGSVVGRGGQANFILSIAATVSLNRRSGAVIRPPLDAGAATDISCTLKPASRGSCPPRASPRGAP